MTRPKMEYAYGNYYNPVQPGNGFRDECRPIHRKVLKRLNKSVKQHIVCLTLFIPSIVSLSIFIYVFDWTHPGVWHSVFTVLCAFSALFNRGWIYDILQRHRAEMALAQISDPENQLMEEIELIGPKKDAEPPHEGEESDPEEINGNQFEGQEQQGGNMNVVVNAEVHHSQFYSPSRSSKESLSAASLSTSVASHDSGLPPASSQQQSSASTSNAATNWLAEEEEST